MSNLTKITDDLWAVQVPVDARQIGFGNHCLGYKTKMQEPEDTNGFTHSKEPQYLFCNKDYEILGTVSETEIDFDTAECVESKISGKVLGNSKLYKMYTTGNWSFFSHNSFRSLLKSKGITPTPETKIVILKKI